MVSSQGIMNIYASGAFVIIGFNALLWYFILSNRKQDAVIKSYLKWSICVALWALGYGITLSGWYDYKITLVINRACHAFALFIPVYFLALSNNLSAYYKPSRLTLTLAYISAIFLSAAALSPYLVEGLWSMGNFKYQPIGGPLYPFFVLHFWVFVIRGLIQLYMNMKRNIGIEKQQIKIFLMGSVVGYLGGSTLFIQGLGIALDPVGVFVISSYVLFTGYAIYRYGFMDLELIIKRATVFAGIFSVLYVAFTFTAFLGKKFLEGYMGWSDWVTTAFPIVIVAIIVRPLDRFLTNITDKYLFQKKYDYKELLRLFTAEVLTIFDADKIAKNTVEALDNIIKLESCSIYINSDEHGKYAMYSHHKHIKKYESNQNDIRETARILAATRRPIERSKEVRKKVTNIHLLDELRRIGGEICLPIFFRNDFIGFISLGRKMSGSDFVQADIEILMSLARTVAIAIKNASLFHDLSQTQAEAAQNEKMAVLGTLAAGINHEICNPLGIIRGQCEAFLLNYKDGLYSDRSDKQIIDQCTVIMNKVIGEADRATGITKRLSSFAKPATIFEVSKVDLGKEIDAVMGILNHEMRLDNITVDNRLPADFPHIYADSKQIQEIVFNIIRNGAQAVGNGGMITIEGSKNGVNATMKISDNGHGIPEDKIKKIFNPFYTTKDPGKGTGLGLFIVKQIVERNNGSIAVQSKEGEGTTFSITFSTKDSNQKVGSV